MASSTEESKRAIDRLKEFPFERLSRSRILGYTLYCSWVLAVFYCTFIYISAIDFRSALYTNMTISLASLALTLILVALLLKNADKWMLSIRVIVPSSVLMAVATAVLVFTDNNTLLGLVLIIISAVLTGISSGLFFLGWVRIFADVGSKIAMIEIALSWFIGALICAVLTFIPSVVSSVLVVVFAFCTGIVLRVCAKHRVGNPKPKRKIIIQKKNRRVFIGGLLAALNLGFVAGFADLISGFRLFNVPEVYGITLIMGVAALTFISLIIFFLSVRSPVMNVYRLLTISIALGCLTIPFMGNEMTYQNTVIYGGYVCFMIILLVISINITSFFDVPATKVAGLAFGVLYIGEMLGFGAAYLLTTFLSNDYLLGVITFLLTGALLFANMFFLTERDLTETSLGKMTESDDDRLDIEALEEKRTTEALTRVIEEYSLTVRESEILPLVYKGRTIARIQEELYISAGTVSTHINHIYRKTGVKGRQELLDLIDEQSKLLD